MRKTVLFLLTLTLLLSLCACSSSEPVTSHTVQINGKDYEVNFENSTVTDGRHTYEYEFSGDSESYSIDIIYPNGSTYYWNQSGYSGHGGWSDDYNESLYVDGDTLCDVIVAAEDVYAPKAANPGKVFAIILLIGLGLMNIADPNIAWYLEYGWRYKNAEPSQLALAVNRISGVIAVIVGVILIFN